MKSLFLQEHSPFAVVFLFTYMAAAVDFDHQPFLNTAEIGYVLPNRKLAPEFHVIQLPVAQAAPEDRFRWRLVLAQPARLLRSGWSRLVQGHFLISKKVTSLLTSPRTSS